MTKEKKISAVYQIKNMVTGERYVGSSNNVYRRWESHKEPSRWKQHPNSKLYKDFQEYGLENFIFSILAPVEKEYLRQVEQEFIDTLQPTYNSNRANGLDVEKRKAYEQSEKRKESHKAYHQSEKYKAQKKAYESRLCNYNGETLTLRALSIRFCIAGIPHPVLEAKKYLLK